MRVRTYQERARRANEIERLATDREKTGVFIGSYATNPANGARVPIYISDYVLVSYAPAPSRACRGPRRARLRVRPQAGPADPGCGGAARLDGGELEAAYVEPGTMVQFGAIRRARVRSRRQAGDRRLG